MPKRKRTEPIVGRDLRTIVLVLAEDIGAEVEMCNWCIFHEKAKDGPGYTCSMPTLPIAFDCSGGAWMIKEVIETMSPVEFEEHKSQLANKYKKEFSKLPSKLQRFFRDIPRHALQYGFTRWDGKWLWLDNYQTDFWSTDIIRVNPSWPGPEEYRVDKDDDNIVETTTSDNNQG